MHPLSANINALHRRLVRQERIVAACRMFATIAAIACVIGLADYWARFNDRGLRLMISTALAAAVAWVVYRWWWLPRQQRPGPLGVARRVEARFPQLHDRLASALEFLEQSEDDPTAGSAALRRAVVADADLAVADLPIDEVIDRRPLRRAAIYAGIVAAVVALLLLINATAVGTAAIRLLAPWGSTEWPREHHLAFRDPPTRLAAGQAFEVELVDRDGELPDNVRIEYRLRRDGRTEIQSEWMNRVGDVMVARRDGVRESFAFRAEGGDDRTMPWHEVEVVDPPKLESLAITAIPPFYTGQLATAAEGHLRVLAGTGIEITGVASEPLGAARVRYGEAVIEGIIRTDDDGRTGRAFVIPSDRFVATENGPYAIELENAEGVAGTAGEWTLRVESDPPPVVTWQQPRVDLFVLPSAVVPIAASVKDNLAIAGVGLKYTISGQPDADANSIELFRGPERIAAAESPGRHQGASQSIEYDWPLAELDLSVGTQLVANVVASDYRPGVGRTIAPRRITIISRDELDARIADRQSQLARRMEEALTSERRIRADVNGLEILLRDAGQVSESLRGTLQSAELAQRRVGHTLTNPADGVPGIAKALVEELRMNGIEATETIAQLDRLTTTLADLADGPLSAADQALTTARKLTQSRGAAATIENALGTAGRAQDEVIRALEELLAEMAGWADLGRLVRELAQLREDQLAHIETSRREIGLDTLPLELRELSREQRATLNKTSAAEAALLKRYERVEADLDALANKLAADDGDEAGRIADAVALARERAIASSMRQAARDFAANLVGQAIVRETEVASAMEEVLDLLRDRTALSPEELLARLSAAEKNLSALRSELARLKQQTAAAERSPDAAADSPRMQRLRDQQRQLRGQITRLARELARLGAADASRSTQQAAGKLGDQAGPPKPADSRDMDQAEQDLAEAARQLATRRAQAEDDWAQKFLDRFQAALTTMVADQKAVIAATAAIEQQRTPQPFNDAQVNEMAELSAKERQLADDVQMHAEFLSGLRVFGLALGKAKDELTIAADRLHEEKTDEPTQAAERRALAHFEQIVWALEQTAAQAQQPPPPGQPGNAGQPDQPRPLFDLFEVKLLRMLQADLNERTQEFIDRTATDAAKNEAGNTNREQAAAQIADELSAEQRRLAELAAEIAARNNAEEEQ